jgi:hypothetical protein
MQREAGFVLFSVASLLSSCLSPQTEMQLRFPYTQVVSDSLAFQLTVDDVRQIVELAKQRSDIRKPVGQIHAVARDEVHVTTGRAWELGGLYSQFDARKKAGRWFIEPGSVYTGRADLITE